jgi:adenosine deaminase
MFRGLSVRDVSELPSGFYLERDLNISLSADSLSSYLKPWQVLRIIAKSKSNLRMMVESAFLNLTFANSLLFNVDWGK